VRRLSEVAETEKVGGFRKEKLDHQDFDERIGGQDRSWRPVGVQELGVVDMMSEEPGGFVDSWREVVEGRREDMDCS
jgi:hypothetical protein